MPTPIPFIGSYTMTAGQNHVRPSEQVNTYYYGGSTNPSNSNGKFATATLSNGSVTISGDQNYGNSGVDTTFLSNDISILAVIAEGGFVAIKSDGSLKSFGGAGGNKSASNIAQIAVSMSGWIALKSDGTLIGAGSYQSNTPIGSNFTKVYAGGYGGYAALTTSGDLISWGYPLSSPVTTSGGVQNVAFNYGSGIALKNNGSIATWGSSGDAAVLSSWNFAGVAKQETYSLTADTSSVNEGSTATFTLTTTNVASGTSVPYTLSGISAADLSGGSLSGNAVVNSSGVATISVSLLNDLLTEGSETLTVTANGASVSTVVNDTSKAPTQVKVTEFAFEFPGKPPLTKPPYAGSVSTAEYVEFSLLFSEPLNTPPIAPSLSFVLGAQTLIATVARYSGSTITFRYQVSAQDLDTDGIEIKSLNLNGGVITSTSGGTVNPEIPLQYRITQLSVNSLQPSYAVTSSAATVNEGSTATFTLTTTNVASGTSVPYTLSGISAADTSGGSLSGNATVNSSGVATISVTLLNDSLTEGSETLTVTAGGATASTVVNDTSKAPTYSIYAGNASYNEGQTIEFVFSATNVSTFTSLTYTISGVSSSDVSYPLSGTIQFSSGPYGYTFYLPLANDGLTEGDETLTVSIGGVSASAVIKDTSKAAATPSYSLVASNASVNEGSTATFILNTSNVTAGTSVSYTISGIGASDVSGGSLSGMTTVASNGQATITVLLANDNLTEGTETLTITAGGASASTQINDTSKAASATYAVSTNWTSTTEGTPIVATLSTTNVSAGTTLYYQLYGSGITTSDFGGLSLTGSSVINSSGQASLTIPLSADTTTEGDETFVIQYYTDSGRSIAAGSAGYVTILDTSKGAVTPTYAVSTNSSSVNEGSTADFVITTSNVSAGSSIAYTLSGVSSTDITGGALTGFATVNSSGTASVSVPIVADSLTEGSETLTISLQGKTASILINDTSKAAAVPTYDLVSSSSSVNEGSVASFSLTTTGVSPGTSVAYTISGVSSSDVTGGLNGTATVDINGLATISVPVAADFLTEGTETLTVTAQGKSASVLVNDTSKTTLIASYALSASTNSVSEGSSAVFTLTTTNVAGGTSIPYTISGVSSGDITGGALSGTAIVSSSGNATITIPLALDLTTEGTESLTVTAQGISASVLISDTSTTPVVVTPTTTVTSIPYGDGKYFYGSSGSDKVTGTSFVDVVKQTSTISSNQLTKLSDGSWQVQNKITPLNSDNLVNVERIEFSDLSVALDVSGPAGQVAKILGSVFGKSYVSNTEFAGIGFAYLDGGMTYLDLCGLAAGAAGLTTPDLLVTTLLRNTTGTEPTALSKSSYLQSISSGASYASVVQQIADSSANTQSIKLTDLANTGLAYTPYVLPPTYSLSASTASVNEGSTAVFNLTTTNIAVGTEVSYTLSGISPSDLTLGTLTGKVSVGVGGTASISVPIAADGATEGQESLTISAQGANASIVINDTSKSIASPTYTLTPAALSVNEGELARVYVNTTNVAAGTVLQYGVSGISSTDLIGGLTRQVTVDSLGQAFINIQTIADQITEGPETMYITLGTSTTSFIINDTSVTLVGVIDNGGGDGGGGGGGGGGD